MQVVGEAGVAGFDDASGEHHVCVVRLVEFEQSFVVRDNQDAGIGSGQFCQAFADDFDGIAVETAVGFVEQCEAWLEQGQLQDFHPFLFPAGEPVVEVSAGELGIEPQFVHLFSQQCAELAHRDQSLAILAFGIANIGDGVAEKIGDLHAGNGDRILEGQEDASTGSLVGIHFEQIVAIDCCLSAGDPVQRVPGQGVRQGAFARTVGAHQRVDLAGRDFQCHALQDRSLTDGDVQIGDREHAGHCGGSLAGGEERGVDVRGRLFF